MSSLKAVTLVEVAALLSLRLGTVPEIIRTLWSPCGLVCELWAKANVSFWESKNPHTAIADYSWFLAQAILCRRSFSLILAFTFARAFEEDIS